ncbi:Ankyrin repeat domain-containing protein SOWAHC [Galemys pyrenaicus]|uniref:Ankyrin repeat domain-containing protein SOWAHC n=1 Tax=Galemys pyrenaicus TaxID=202257 RepID=A0A8J6A842_GALPY|nr:Ankyrin repeat domain-containing protein SOWAHC [Galemys pyrenaicus]
MKITKSGYTAGLFRYMCILTYKARWSGAVRRRGLDGTGLTCRPQRSSAAAMEGPAELEPQAVLRFLAERGGRAPHAELVGHFRSALGGEPESRARARARFKELVNSVATVRTDPADGTKYVHLKRKFCEGSQSAEAEPEPLPVLPCVSGTAEHEPAAGILDEAVALGESGLGPEEPSERGAEPNDGEAPAAVLGLVDPTDDGRNRRPVASGGTWSENSGCDLQPPPRSLAPGLEGDLAPHGCEETDAGGIPGEVATLKNLRLNSRDLALGSSPQLKRSNPGAASGGGRGKGGGDLDDVSVASSLAEEESGGGSSVALDPLEHAWMLSAAEGQWDSLEGLLSSDPGLLAKRDFITGFTCLHWAAKHGRQEVLALLVNFANKHQMPVNINARTSGGYTALHLAAMHGHAEVVKLLVGAYDADVDARDYSGRKAAQYLSQSTAEEIKNLVGALDLDQRESAAGGGGGRWRLSKVLPYRLSHMPEDGGDPHHHLTEGLAGGKVKDPGRKASGSSSGRIKPRLNKIRFRTQIVHTTPSFRDLDQPLEEGEEEEEDDHSLKGHSSSFKLRPKSNVFG